MTKRITAALLLLAALGAVIGLWQIPARAQVGSPVIPSVRIVGRHSQVADVTHLGELIVNAQVNATVDNIRHISSVTHVAIVGGLSVQSVSGPVPHISSTTHVSGNISSFGKQATDVVDTANSALKVNVVSGGLSSGGSVSQSGSWTIQAAHQGGQWNIAHISGVTHVAVASGSVTVTGGPVAVTQSGAWTNLNINHIASVVHVAIAGASGGSLPVNQSGSWIITADHQAGEWNVRHIGSETHVAVVRGTLDRVNHVTSVVHVAGIIRGFGAQGTNVVDTGNAALQVSCVAGCSSNTSIAHITSVVHVAGAGGGLRVQQASQFGGNRWVIDHIASSVHVVAGGGSFGAIQTGEWKIAHISSVVHVAGQLEAVGQWNTAHITSVVHVAGIVRGFGIRGIDVTDIVNNALQINCVAGCTSNTSIAHVSSVLHVGGSVGAIPVTVWIRDGATTRLAHVDASGNLQVSATITSVSHITSVTHIAGSVAVPVLSHISQAVHVAGIIRGFGKQGTDVLDSTNQSLQVSVVAGSSSSSQSGIWNITAHLGSISNIQHIGGSLHLAGTINGARIHIQGVGQPGAAHGGVMSIQGVSGMVPLEVNCTGCSAAASVNVAHVSVVQHIGGSYGAIPVAIQLRDSATTRFAHVDTSGALSVSATIGSVSHITSVMHVRLIPSSNASDVIAVHATVSHIQSTVHVAGIIRGFGAQGTNVVDTANASLQVSCVSGCAQGTTLPHITSVTHVQGSMMIADKQDQTRTVAVTHSNALTVHIASIGPNNGNPSFCHSVAAFVIHDGTQVAPVIHVAVGRKVAICGIVLTSGGAVDVSIVEGNTANGDTNNQAVWSGGCGGRVGSGGLTAWTPLIGGLSKGLALSANSGFSSVAGIPWLQTQTRGNSVCVVKMQGTSHVSGTITYAGF